MHKLSVIVPVYNMEKYVEKCLNSLINQIIDDMEIIVVNDGSTDNSKKIIQQILNRSNEKMANSKIEIKYYEKENGGLSSARNYGLKYATGEYIAFLDSDDYVEKDMYKEMYEKAKKYNADMVECDFIWEYEEKPKKDKRRKYKNNEDFFKRPRVMAWNKIIRKNLIDENNISFPENLIYEDLEFFYKLFPYLEKVSYVDKYFVHYVQRENSISNRQTEKVSDIFKILDNIIKYYGKNEMWWRKYKKSLKYVYRRILLGSNLKRIFKIKNKTLRKDLIGQTLRHLKWSEKRDAVYDKKKRICFGITKLDIGGAERVLVDIVNNIYDKYDVTIFTIYKNGVLEKELNKNIKLVSLYKKYNVFIPIYVLLFRKHIYNKYIKNNFDTEIAFLEGCITRIFSCKGNSTKLAWIHNDIKRVFGNNIKTKIKISLDKKIYAKYDEIIFVSEDNRKSFNELYGEVSKEKVIYNYIDKKRILDKANEICRNDNETEYGKGNGYKYREDEPLIVSVSRLTKQKGIARFIRVHKKLLDEGIKHKVIIIGEGEERKKLEKLIKKLQVDDSFLLIGKKENPYPYMKMADYFALLSFYEGYGMVIEEAKILNKKIIITDTAAREAVQNYENAVIIPNNEEDIFMCLKFELEEK